MNIIYETVTGSRLHGTDDEFSDTDIKGIYIPKGRDILLNRVAPSIKIETNPNKANTSEDVDREYYSLLTFLTKVSEGDINALDVFFSPTEHPTWYIDAIRNNKDKLIVKGEYQGWARFVRSMNGKYGSTNVRLRSLGAVVFILESLGNCRLYDGNENMQKRLGDFEITLRCELADLPHVNFVDIVSETGIVTHLEVCGKRYPFSANLKGAVVLFRNLKKQTEKRAVTEPTPEEWTEIAHAIRIANQSLELLDTHLITFPRKNADYLRKVKRGLVPFEDVAETLDFLASALPNHLKYSSLPEKPDTEWIEKFVMSVYSEQIRLEIYRNTL